MLFDIVQLLHLNSPVVLSKWHSRKLRAVSSPFLPLYHSLVPYRHFCTSSHAHGHLRNVAGKRVSRYLWSGCGIRRQLVDWRRIAVPLTFESLGASESGRIRVRLVVRLNDEERTFIDGSGEAHDSLGRDSRGGELAIENFGSRIRGERYGVGRRKGLSAP